MPYQSAHEGLQMLTLKSDGTAAQPAHYELLGDPTVEAADLAARFALQEAVSEVAWHWVATSVTPAATLSAMQTAHTAITSALAGDATESTTAALASQGAVLAGAAKGS